MKQIASKIYQRELRKAFAKMSSEWTRILHRAGFSKRYLNSQIFPNIYWFKSYDFLGLEKPLMEQINPEKQRF